jgi:hypothetical protein
MSRNRANEFSDGMLTAVGKQGLVFRICFSGRTLSKYGKVYPINYYGSNDNRGEMEDRLVSDVNLIPFSDFDYVDVLLPRGLSTTDYQRKLIKAVSERVRCRVFDNPKKFFSGRGDVEFDFDVAGEVNLGGDLFGDDGVAEIIIKYFEGGELTDDEKDELRRAKLFNILNTVNTGSEVGHRLRLVMRKAGVEDVKDMEDRLFALIDGRDFTAAVPVIVRLAHHGQFHARSVADIQIANGKVHIHREQLLGTAFGYGEHGRNMGTVVLVGTVP